MEWWNEGTRELLWSVRLSPCDESGQRTPFNLADTLGLVQRFRAPLPVSGSLFGRSECRWPTALLAAETHPISWTVRARGALVC